jgi:hypothetical protein
MQTMTQNLNRWTTEELLDEVVRRTATDAPGLELLQTIVIRARLAESDRRLGGGRQSELGPVRQAVGVRGTLEMGLADSED